MRKRRFRAAKKSASEENLRRKRLKNKTEKPFMKRIPAKKAASDENLRRRRQKSSLRRT